MFVLEHIKKYAKTDRMALINRNDTLSFEELDSRSEAFAAHLLERFGDDRTPIIIYGHKESDFLCCIYGSLKSGRAYVDHYEYDRVRIRQFQHACPKKLIGDGDNYVYATISKK